MKNTFAQLFILFIACFVHVNAFGVNKGWHTETNPLSDSVGDVKNNVVVFKLISTPTTNSNSGSLKNAGKVARTSYSHSTSLENIIYKKKGI